MEFHHEEEEEEASSDAVSGQDFEEEGQWTTFVMRLIRHTHSNVGTTRTVTRRKRNGKALPCDQGLIIIIIRGTTRGSDCAQRQPRRGRFTILS
jgi:hypothetical protein